MKSLLRYDDSKDARLIMVDDLRPGDVVLTGQTNSVIIENKLSRGKFNVKTLETKGMLRGVKEYTFVPDTIYYYGIHLRGGKVVED